MKVKELSLLIVEEDQTIRQLLASIVSDRHRAVTAVAPEDVGSLIMVESFDMMISRRIGLNFSAGDADDSRVGEGVTSVAPARSGVSGQIYDFRAINQGASRCHFSPRF